MIVRWCSDRGPGDFSVCVVCKGMENCGRKSFVLGTDSEHLSSALRIEVCQARTEETIHENAPM